MSENVETNVELKSKTDTKKNSKKIVLIGFLIVVVIAVVVFFFTSDSRNYNKAVKLYNNQEYATAYDIFVNLADYEESTIYAQKCEVYIEIEEFLATESYIDAVDIIRENKSIFSDENEYKKLLDDYKYLLAEQQYKNKHYVDAYNNLIDNEHTNATKLLKEIEPFYNSEKSVDDILETYQWMSDWLDKMIDSGSSYYEKQLIINSGAEWDTFYINRGATIVNIQKKLETKTLDECSSDIKDLIGYLPENKEECKKVLAELQEVFITKGGYKDYNGYFLYYVMNCILDSDLVSVTRDEEQATITIKQVDKYLKEKNMSAKTFAYMLGVPQMYSMNLEKENECLKFTFSPFSHNYSFCAINHKDESDKEVEKFIANADSEMTYLYTSGGYDYFEINLSGINKYDLEYLRLVFACSKSDDWAVILSQDNHFLDKNDLSKDKLSITVKYDKNAVYCGYYYMADYN